MSRLTKKDKKYLASLVKLDIDSIKDVLKDPDYYKVQLGLTKKQLTIDLKNARLVLKKLRGVKHE